MSETRIHRSPAALPSWLEEPPVAPARGPAPRVPTRVPATDVADLSAYGGMLLDTFTNEHGLDNTLRKATVRGGMVVGVSGAVLDVASRIRADRVVCVDANPSLCQSVELMVGILRAVDRQLGGPTGDDAERSTMALERIRGPVSPQVVISELPSRDLPRGLDRAGCAAMLAEIREELDKSRGSNTTWIKSSDTPARIGWLSGLARKGRITTVVSNIQDPRWMEQVRQESRKTKTPVTAVHLSNLFDYQPQVDRTVMALGGLPLHPEAILTTSSRLQSAYRPKGLIGEEIGQFGSPGLHQARLWLGNPERASALQSAYWADLGYRCDLRNAAVAAVNGRGSFPTPDTYDELVARTRALAGDR